MAKKKKQILMLLSPRYEMAYRFVDAMLGQSQILRHYELVHIPYSPSDEPVPDFSHLTPDAIITSVVPEIYDIGGIVDCGLPVVNISSGKHDKLISLYVEEESLMRVVVKHALANGFEELVYLGTKGMEGNLANQVHCLEKLAKQEGISTRVEWVTERPFEMPLENWKKENDEFMQSLKCLAGPVPRTLFYTHHDGRAVLMSRLFKQLEIEMPEKVGVLGRSNHQQVKLAVPQISSVEMPYLKMASKAVDLIERALMGENVRAGRVPSGAVVSRASTTALSEEIGPKLSRISQLIEEHAFERLSVDDLAKILRISRSTLERNYRAVHGISPADALRRVQLKRASTLLKQTEMTVAAIASEIGYKSVRSFYKAFEKEFGCVPGDWRER
ncbi:MAG: helix-turn-helix domain-containing protein [Phaeodactylibacter sp.]|nr:helix-turn-helix domain-containing protein [Phaeodactylibacter sp.]